jgi:signal transduction histidine kinase
MVVAAFMVAVSVIMTQAVLARLGHTQERHLAALSGLYLEGLASAVIPYVLREDVWEIFDAIERSSNAAHAFGRPIVVVVDGDGRTLASTDPPTHPIGRVEPTLAGWFEGGSTLSVDRVAGRAHGRRPLLHQDRPIGTIYADYDVRYLFDERAEVLGTLVATNAAITLLMAAVGYWLVRRMLRPLDLLARHIDRGVGGRVEPIPPGLAGSPAGEFYRLFTRFNAMAGAVNDREELAKRLAREERLGSLGRLASGMAHEINNPLGGLFNAIDTLKRHGANPAVRGPALDLVERGLRGIHDVVRATLASYRVDHEPRGLTPADVDDLRLLVGPEAARKAVQLLWTNGVTDDLPIPASPVRQILLNLVLNAVRATPVAGQVAVTLAADADSLVIEVDDQGPGLPKEAAVILAGPRQPAPLADAGGGLGVWITRRMVVELGGGITLGESRLGGTAIILRLPLANTVERRNVA